MRGPTPVRASSSAAPPRCCSATTRASCTSAWTGRSSAACAAPPSWRASEEEARRRLELTDRARYAYVDTLYGVDPGAPGLYSLIVDATAMSLDDCAELVAHAARAWQERRST